MRTLLLNLLLLVCLNGFSQTPEENLSKLGIELPTLPEPIASYVHVVKTGNLLFLSGKGPQQANGEYIKGKLGKDLSTQQGYEAAKLVGILQLAAIKGAVGDLSKIRRIVKVNGFVNSEPNYYDHPKVINGFSDLMIAVFGEKGRHARTSLGVAALPLNMAVEIEVVVEVEEN
ncbi:MAG: RidA family protein [Chitinophagaceae bacterium]|nr:MAG: RidA family protein [Chitinophagaceae bacterium]